MKISNWLFSQFPFLFPNRKKAAKARFEGIMQERWRIVTKRLNAQEIVLPKLALVIPEGASYHKGIVEVSYSESFEVDEEIIRKIDHELSHHIQRSKNSTLKKYCLFYNCSVLYWFLTGKIRHGLAQKAFEEGFAAYVAYLTSGKLSVTTEKVVNRIKNGERWNLLFSYSTLPYALGYLLYTAVTSAKSEEKAIELGLSASFLDWLSESESIFKKDLKTQ
jgi:hypothetical protein